MLLTVEPSIQPQGKDIIEESVSVVQRAARHWVGGWKEQRKDFTEVELLSGNVKGQKGTGAWL